MYDRCGSSRPRTCSAGAWASLRTTTKPTDALLPLFTHSEIAIADCRDSRPLTNSTSLAIARFTAGSTRPLRITCARSSLDSASSHTYDDSAFDAAK